MSASGVPGSGRLIVLARELTRGGAAYLALRHARTMRAAGYAVDFAVTGPCDDSFLAELPLGCAVHRLTPSEPAEGEGPFDFLRRFARENAGSHAFDRDAPYDALLATSTFPDLAACAAAATVPAGRRLVFLVDETLASYPRLGRTAAALTRSCLAAADRVLPVSRRLWLKLAAACPPLRDRPWRCVPPPVDGGELRALASEPQAAIPAGPTPAVLSVGRLAPEKQLPLCARAHALLKERGLDFRWYVAGAGDEEGPLREEVARLGLGDDFVLLGRQVNVPALIGACDAFAHFSKSEGCPTVVLEALALGKPVAATAVNGVDEHVEDGVNGLVVAGGLDGIAGGLGRLVGDDALRGRFAAALRGRGPTEAEGAGRALLSELAVALPPPPAPRATVLIPTYNQEGAVGRAVAGALEQDVPGLEVVLLDDASPDGTAGVARSWAFDPRFRSARNEANLGRAGNYRNGLRRHARGRYVLLLDGDDVLTDPGFLGLACDALDRHRRLGRPALFAQGGHVVHHPDGSWPDAEVRAPLRPGEAERYVTGAEYLRLVFETGFFTHLGAVYDREAALGLGGGFYRLDLSSSDMDAFLRLALRGGVVLLGAVAGRWVQHGGNASSGLRLDDFAANAGVFRAAAGEAVALGLATWDDLDGPLTGYEARTLLYLLKNLRGGPRPGDLGRFLDAARAVNPRLLDDPDFLDAARAAAAPRPAPGPPGGEEL